MLVGYARVSTIDQNPELQLDALKKAGCEKIYVETASGAHRERPQLAAALNYLREGDTLVIWKLSRLARSLKLVIKTAQDMTAGFDKYILDFLLRKSEALQCLGRMTWAEAHSEEATSADRINIHQAIISLVDEAGRPLSTSEIRHRLIALRGVNEGFRIAAVDPLIRLGTAEWGLNDRDVPIKRCDQPALIEYLVETLQKKSSGIHISEIQDVALQAWPGLTAQMNFSLAILDARMRVGAGQYLYLEAWGTPRCATLSEAVQCIRG